MLCCTSGRAALIVLLSIGMVLQQARNTKEICAMVATICYYRNCDAFIASSTMQRRILALGAHQADQVCFRNRYLTESSCRRACSVILTLWQLRWHATKGPICMQGPRSCERLLIRK